MEYFFDHVRLTPDKQIGEHTQPSFDLSYIITGSGVRTIGGVSEPFGPGAVVLVPPGMLHHFAFDPTVVDNGGCIENISFHFTTDFLEQVARTFPECSERVLHLRHCGEAVRFTGEARTDIIGALTAIDAAAVEDRPAYILSLVQHLSRLGETVRISDVIQVGTPQQRLDKIRIYVSCNYNKPLSINEISSYVGMNRTAFCSFFKKETGRSFVTYLNEYRIEKACELLRDRPEMDITDVALAVGFNELPHFTRTFKRYRSCSPSAWRRQ